MSLRDLKKELDALTEADPDLVHDLIEEYNFEVLRESKINRQKDKRTARAKGKVAKASRKKNRKKR